MFSCLLFIIANIAGKWHPGMPVFLRRCIKGNWQQLRDSLLNSGNSLML